MLFMAAVDLMVLAESSVGSTFAFPLIFLPGQWCGIPSVVGMLTEWFLRTCNCNEVNQWKSRQHGDMRNYKSCS